jgi:hypothetical protein
MDLTLEILGHDKLVLIAVLVRVCARWRRHGSQPSAVQISKAAKDSEGKWIQILDPRGYVHCWIFSLCTSTKL